MEIKVRANAKINLFLDILGKREDGYHYVNMIMQSIDLYDIIKIETVKEDQRIFIESNYTFDVPIEKNTVYKASEIFLESCGRKDQGIKITVHKNIPVYAGLAGGSADAAAVLVGLNSLFNAGFSQKSLMKMGESIGADVPFCVSGGTMIATNVGTDLKPISKIPDCYIIIVKPNINVSTKHAYDMSDRFCEKKNVDIQKIIHAIESRNLNGICDKLFNRFEQVMFIDEVNKIKSILKQNRSKGESMSGSGPSVFGIFEKEEDARFCFEKLKRIYDQTFLCRPCDSGFSFIEV